MIAKFKNRMDFAGVVNYATDKKNDAKRGRLIAHQGVCAVSNETIADSFNTNLRRPDSRGRIHNLSQPVKHVSISFSPRMRHYSPTTNMATASWFSLSMSGCMEWESPTPSTSWHDTSTRRIRTAISCSVASTLTAM